MWQKRQRVISRSEPELGSGLILDVDLSQGVIETLFPTAQERRRYAIGTAPLQRHIASIGDVLVTASGEKLAIEAVRQQADGLVSYSALGKDYGEYEIDLPLAGRRSALEALLAGPWSHHRGYELRREAWAIRSKMQSTKVRGLVGARVTPLPHQLFIAAEVSRRPFPRVLLADEVGLGKTIEAGLIYAAMKSLGRADRVLVVAPESLVNQWMAELYRRFGDMFSILDSERCAEEEASLGLSPFQANQRVIVALDFLLAEPERLREAQNATWDLLIMDEAHHLDWDPEEPNPRWLVAKQLSAVSRGLLLLTATPRQHGLATQFGLLNLVDPQRYGDFDEFVDEAERMKEMAQIAKSLADGQLPAAMAQRLAEIFQHDPQILPYLKAIKPSPEALTKILNALVDRHGTGRVLFRNRRERLQGFPARHLHAVPLPASKAYALNLETLDPQAIDDLQVMDYATGRGVRRSFRDRPSENPRYLWLLNFIAGLGESKALLICASKERVDELQDFLELRLPDSHKPGKQVAVFYEGLSVVERDKQAALFADPKGAQVLISSEIGGEGRNFQFTNKLVLMDLPRLPDLLEQRIGRLDRIGQAHAISIYVPWLRDTPEEVLFNWYHRGLDAFETSWNGADPLLEHFVDDLLTLFRGYMPRHPAYAQRAELLANLIKRTQTEAQLVRQERAESVDILVDLNSFNEEEGEKLLAAVEDSDDDASLEFFMRAIFDHYGIDYEDFDDRGSLVVHPDSLTFIDKFPGLDDDRPTVLTFDRALGLVREDFVFLTPDHPLAESSLALLLDRNEGAVSFCKWPDSPHGDGVLVELSFILEASGARKLELGRFLPIVCQQITLDQSGRAITRSLPSGELAKGLVPLSEDEVPEDRGRLKALLQPLVRAAEASLAGWAAEELKAAKQRAEEEGEEELGRLRYLAEINPSISRQELEERQALHSQVLAQLAKATPRLDSLRLIFTS